MVLTFPKPALQELDRKAGISMDCPRDINVSSLESFKSNTIVESFAEHDIGGNESTSIPWQPVQTGKAALPCEEGPEDYE